LHDTAVPTDLAPHNLKRKSRELHIQPIRLLHCLKTDIHLTSVLNFCGARSVGTAVEKAPSSDLVIERFNVTGKYEMESSSSSGIVVPSTTSEVPASTVATHTTISLRPEDVQAIDDMHGLIAVGNFYIICNSRI